MSIQKSFTLYPSTLNEIDWEVIDSTGAIVNNASVLLTLYWGRDKVRLDLVSGVPVSNVNAVSMTFSSSTNSYSGQFTFTPAAAPPGGDYTLVVDATLATTPVTYIGHWERPAVVVDTGI